jgi:hypothetical protein
MDCPGTCKDCTNNPDPKWIVPRSGKFEGYRLCPLQDDLAEQAFGKYARFPKGTTPPFVKHTAQELKALDTLNPDSLARLPLSKTTHELRIKDLKERRLKKI